MASLFYRSANLYVDFQLLHVLSCTMPLNHTRTCSTYAYIASRYVTMPTRHDYVHVQCHVFFQSPISLLSCLILLCFSLSELLANRAVSVVHRPWRQPTLGTVSREPRTGSSLDGLRLWLWRDSVQISLTLSEHFSWATLGLLGCRSHTTVYQRCLSRAKLVFNVRIALCQRLCARSHPSDSVAMLLKKINTNKYRRRLNKLMK